MPKDPYAAIAKPIASNDPYAAIAQPQTQVNAPTTPPSVPQHGFFSSALSAPGGVGDTLSGIGHMLGGAASAVIHPVDTAKAVWNATSDDSIKAAVAPYVGEAKQAYQAAGQGNYGQAVGHAAMAVPIVGDAVKKAANQVINAPSKAPVGQSYASDLGATVSNPGAMGTLAGTASGLTVVPKVAGAAMSGVGNYAPKVAGTIAKAAGSTPESIALAGSKIMARGTVGETLVRATKPGVKFGPAGDVADSYEATLPKALAENPNIKGVDDLGQAYDAAKEANASAFNAQVSQYKPGFGTTPRPSMIDGSAVADAQVDSVPFIRKFENPSIIGDTVDKSDPYRGDMTIPTANDLRVGSNQQLHGMYEQSNGNQYAAMGNPETARYKAVGDAIRDQQYPIMDSDFNLAPGTTASNQQMYGQLADAGNAANKRGLVFGRQDPVSLAEKMAAGHGGPIATMFNVAKEKAIASMTNSDGLVRSAVDRVSNPGGPMTSLQPRSGIIPQALSYTGEGLANASPALSDMASFGGKAAPYSALLPPKKKGQK